MRNTEETNSVMDGMMCGRKDGRSSRSLETLIGEICFRPTQTQFNEHKHLKGRTDKAASIFSPIPGAYLSEKLGVCMRCITNPVAWIRRFSCNILLTII